MKLFTQYVCTQTSINRLLAAPEGAVLANILRSGRIVYPFIDQGIKEAIPGVYLVGDGEGPDMRFYSKDDKGRIVKKVQNKNYHSVYTDANEVKHPDQPRIHVTKSGDFDKADANKKDRYERINDYCSKYDWFCFGDVDALVDRNELRFFIVPSITVSTQLHEQWDDVAPSYRGKVSLNWVRSQIKAIEFLS